MTKKKGKLVNPTYIGVIKGVISAMIITILAILIYAVVLKTFSMNDSTIPYFNQVIKIIGILIASYYSVIKSNKLYVGAIGGIAYVLLAYLLFSAVNAGFGNTSVLGADITMGAVIGGIFAIIIQRLNVNTKTQKQ